MSIADDRIDDADIGPMWTKHFPRITNEVVSKTLVLTLVYLIEDKAKVAADVDWSDHVSRELRKYGIPSEQFWEIYSALR
jgi:hypothetical protein